MHQDKCNFSLGVWSGFSLHEPVLLLIGDLYTCFAKTPCPTVTLTPCHLEYSLRIHRGLYPKRDNWSQECLLFTLVIIKREHTYIVDWTHWKNTPLLLLGCYSGISSSSLTACQIQPGSAKQEIDSGLWTYLHWNLGKTAIQTWNS